MVRDDRVLLAQRPAGGRHAGRWEFPGGKVEPGESLEECLAREIEEELGLKINIIKYLSEVFHDYGEFSISLHPFICRFAGPISPEGGEEIRTAMVLWEELKKYDLLPPDREIVKMLGAEFNPAGGRHE